MSRAFPVSAGTWTGLGWGPGSSPNLLTHDSRLVTSPGPQFPLRRNGDNNRTSFLAMMALGQDEGGQLHVYSELGFPPTLLLPSLWLPKAEGSLPG